MTAARRPDGQGRKATLKARLTEWRWDLKRGLVDPWLRPLRDCVWPNNVLRIRNLPRSWSDRDQRVLHAVFSILCEFVEEEGYDYASETPGRAGIEARLVWLKAQVESGETPAEHHEREVELLRLYDWYSKQNWKEPLGMKWTNENSTAYRASEAAFERECDEMLVRAIKNRGCWWT